MSMHGSTLQSFSEMLRDAREVNGISVNELAHAVGVDPSYVSRLENDERLPGRRVVARLALILEAPLALTFRDQLFEAAGFVPEVTR